MIISFLIVLWGATQTCRKPVWSARVIGAQTTRCTDDGAALEAARLCVAPGPGALHGDVHLVRVSWGPGTAAWHARNILKASWGKAVEPAKHGHPGSLPWAAELPSMAGLWPQQHLLLMAIASPAQGQQTAGESPLPTRTWLVLLEMSQGIQDFVAWNGETWHRAHATPMSSWRKS